MLDLVKPQSEGEAYGATRGDSQQTQAGTVGGPQGDPQVGCPLPGAARGPICSTVDTRGGHGKAQPCGHGTRPSPRVSQETALAITGLGARGQASALPGVDTTMPSQEELLRSDPLLPAGTQRVCLVHPEVKWGAGKPQLTRAEWQVAEARALVHTLAGWSVVETTVVSTKKPERRLIFGKGNFEHLTERIRGSPEITCVFLNVERLSPPTKVPGCLADPSGGQPQGGGARPGEARLQVALAEIPLLRSVYTTPHQVHRTRSIHTTLHQVHEPGLSTPPHTRCTEPGPSTPPYTRWKTTLIRALTGDEAAQPRDQLFATLDITAHAGSLPSRMTVLYMDTIGFLSQLPHGLIESFSATLEDVAHSDVIVHVRDVSHPETELQKVSVLSALQGMGLPAPLLDSVVEVHNKVDLVPGYRPPDPSAVAVSALLGQGLEELRLGLEEAVLRATGRQVLTLHIQLAGPQLSWLYKEATVQQVDVLPEAGAAHVKVVAVRRRPLLSPDPEDGKKLGVSSR
uniref:Hflx-type G domain-containing protein n=1 Tax=Spermophilus dauricus TaxID=99837 RepID=A0A8C9Q4P4_SPEDA